MFSCRYDGQHYAGVAIPMLNEAFKSLISWKGYNELLIFVHLRPSLRNLHLLLSTPRLMMQMTKIKQGFVINLLRLKTKLSCMMSWLLLGMSTLKLEVGRRKAFLGPSLPVLHYIHLLLFITRKYSITDTNLNLLSQ